MNSYEERQYLRNSTLGKTLIAIVIFILVFIIINSNSGKGIIVAGILALIVIMLFLFGLYTRVDEHGISYRFYPFQGKYHTFSWTGIKDAFIKTYKPISDFGGWGWRQSLKANATAFTMYGNTGIEIILDNGKRILIGTQQPEELAANVKKYIGERFINA